MDDFEWPQLKNRVIMASLTGNRGSVPQSYLPCYAERASVGLSLIDAFAPTLCVHLTDGIPTLLSLSRFGSSLPGYYLRRESRC